LRRNVVRASYNPYVLDHVLRDIGIAHRLVDFEHVEDDVLRMGKRVCDEEVWSGDVLPPGGEVFSYPGCRIPVAMNKFLLRYLVEFKGFR